MPTTLTSSIPSNQLVVSHECDIPSITSLASDPTTQTLRTSLSFCLPTSLAFAKRLTWEQTPWNPHSVLISPTDAQTICSALDAHTTTAINPSAVQNALLFGSTYPPHPPVAAFGCYPTLFVVFPHAHSLPAHDEAFLRVWHDGIVKPAFDRAWSDSRLCASYKEAFPVSGFLRGRRNGAKRVVRAAWPEWHDEWGAGSEGCFSAQRARVYNDAWDAIKGMLRDYPGMEEYREPLLLAVSRVNIHLQGMAGPEVVNTVVGREWDRFVDSRFLIKGSFRVVTEGVVGGKAVRMERNEGDYGGKHGRERETETREKEGGEGEQIAMEAEILDFGSRTSTGGKRAANHELASEAGHAHLTKRLRTHSR